MAPALALHSVRSAPFARILRLRGMLGALALLAMPWGARAQLLDSLAIFSRERPRFVAKLDSRGSFISNSNVRLFGVKAGVEHDGRLQYGVGYAFLSSHVGHDRTVDGRPGQPVELRLSYATPYVEYAFYQRGPWEARIPVQFGIGGARLVHAGADGARRTVEQSFVLFYEPAMTVQYRFLRWFGAGAGWGFRLQLGGSRMGENLTAPVYLLGLKVFMGELWADINCGGRG